MHFVPSAYCVGLPENRRPFSELLRECRGIDHQHAALPMSDRMSLSGRTRRVVRGEVHVHAPLAFEPFTTDANNVAPRLDRLHFRNDHQHGSDRGDAFGRGVRHGGLAKALERLDAFGGERQDRGLPSELLMHRGFGDGIRMALPEQGNPPCRTICYTGGGLISATCRWCQYG
jgi:hypothetical protein